MSIDPVVDTGGHGPSAVATTLSAEALTTLQKSVGKFPEGTRVDLVSVRRLGEDNFASGALLPQLFDHESLQRVDEQLAERVLTGQDGVSVCGYKVPIVETYIRVQKPGERAVEIYAVAQALLVITDSPVHVHGATIEEYTLLNPSSFPRLCRALREKGLEVEFTEQGAMVSGPRSDRLSAQDVFADKYDISPGLIHGFCAPQEGQAILVLLTFIPGLVPKDKSAFPPGCEFEGDPVSYRDEELIGVQARAENTRLRG